MKVTHILAAAALLVELGCPSSASAISHRFKASGVDVPAAASAMSERDEAMAPIAYVRFCMRNQSQCHGTRPSETIASTLKNWQTLAAVNTLVNGRIKGNPAKGSIDWSLETRHGNCNDYAVQKRQELIERGFPASALALTVTVTGQGEGHLVLIARTDRGDFVLDNLRSSIIAWNRTGYHWVMRQSAEDPQKWVKLDGLPAAVAVASVMQPELTDPAEGVTQTALSGADAAPTSVISVANAPLELIGSILRGTI